MTCPYCKGLITWEPPNPPFPAHYRCQNCRQAFKKHEIEQMRKQEKNSFKEAAMETPEPKVEKPEKTCMACGRRLPATEEYFHKHRGCKYGLNSRCKDCLSARSKERWKNKKKAEPIKQQTKNPHNGNGDTRKLDKQNTISIPEQLIRAVRSSVAKEICGVIMEHFGV